MCNNRSHIVRIDGGLGNQMFQHAFGKALEIRSGIKVKYDITHINSRYFSLSRIFRDFDLDIFSLDVDIATTNEIKYYTLPKGNTNYFVYNFLRKFRKENNVIKENSTQYDINYLDQNEPKYFIGYWQSYKYFNNISDDIKHGFKINNILPVSTGIQKDITNSNSVCVGFRRIQYAGDKLLGTLTGSYFDYYYNTAIEFINGKIENPVFYIFSDDIEWCKSNVHIKGKHKFVEDIHNGFKYSNKMILMSLCKHFIIPNSTFFWWPAWLADNKGKIVIAPKKWFNNKYYFSHDLIPEEWITI